MASEHDYGLLSSYAGLLTLATTSIYIGSFSSLPKPKKTKKGKDAESDSEDEEDIIEPLSSQEAYLFPIIGSVTLLGLFLIIKYVGKEWINWVLGWYFTFSGFGSVWKTSISAAKKLVGAERWKKFEQYTFSIRCRTDSEVLLSVSARTPSLLMLPAALAFVTLYSASGGRSVLLSNILSLSFCNTALAYVRLDSFATGTILLSGLFLYDIWWVFGTPVMVSVATSIDAPIKLLWPKSLDFGNARGYTMLGLGDVVVPGIFVALALRYDYHRFIELSSKNIAKATFKKPYFHAALVAYVSGLVTTMAVMHTFKAAQPALLYLSPACIISFLIIACARGEFADAWGWSDTTPEQPSESERHIKST